MPDRLTDRLWTWLLVPATAALLVSSLTLSRHAYTGLSVQDGRIVAVEPASPGERAGLLPGDRLSPAGPRQRPDPLAPGPEQTAAPGVPVLLTLERGTWRGPVWLAPETLPPAERRLLAVQLVIAAGFLLIAGWVWSERRDRLTRVFLLLGLSFAGMLAPPPAGLSHGWQLTYELLFTAAQLLVGPLFLHFFALFPEPAAHPRTRVWVRLAYGAAAVLLLAYLGVVIDASAGTGRGIALLTPLGIAANALFGLGIVGGLITFAASFVRTADADARRRLRVAFFGTLLGVLPVTGLIVWHRLAPAVAIPFERWSIAALLMVPGSFGWAIAVHRVFDFRVALRAALALIAGAVVVAAVYAGGEWLAATWWPTLGAGVSGASLALLVLAASFAGPLRALVHTFGERVVPISDDLALAAWSPSEAAIRSGESARLLQEACEAIARSLRLDGCAAVRREGAAVRIAATTGARLMPTVGAGFFEAAARWAAPREVHATDYAAEDRDTLELAGVHWTLAIPGEPSPAAFLLGHRLAGGWLDRHEARDLEQLAQHLAVALENVELRREARSHGVLEKELREAQHVQLKRLPRRTPVYPTLDCAAVTFATESVGGDYYDFIEAGPRDFTLAVGDAAGHGVAAALVLAGVQSRFRDEAQRARHPAELLEALNRDLVALEQPEKFMGLLCARIDVTNAVMRFANAGITPPLVRRAGGRHETLTESGLLLGVSPLARYTVSGVELDAGDVVVVSTDGLSEASRDGEMFGEDGIRAVLDAHGHRRASDVVEELVAAVRAWADGPLDDLTVVVLKQLTRPASRSRAARSALKTGA
jgi:serine phosphatase RsbU (regulator of sigma subunit)